MQEDRKKLREFEIENLREEFQKNPALFNQRTINATIEDIAGQLHAPSDAVQYAGIKDKNAITSQQISIRKKSLEEVKKVNSSYFFLKDFEVGNGVVEIGGLSGNWFTILIRTDQSFNPDAFLEKINKLERNGFYNFYYVQRFGTPRLIAHTLGALLLQGKYKEAVETMLF